MSFKFRNSEQGLRTAVYVQFLQQENVKGAFSTIESSDSGPVNLTLPLE